MSETQNEAKRGKKISSTELKDDEFFKQNVLQMKVLNLKMESKLKLILNVMLKMLKKQVNIKVLNLLNQGISLVFLQIQIFLILLK